MNVLLVFLGGGLGAVARYFLSFVFSKASYFPINTMVANFLGCFVAAAVFTYFVSKNVTCSEYKSFLIVGFCGGLSTLSALSLELMEFVQTGEYLRAFLYVITTIFVCSLSVLLGIIVVQHIKL